MSLRINWFANAPFANTGYGVQTRLFTPRIKALGHEVSISAFHGLEGSLIHWADGIPVYPRAFHPYGQDVMTAHAHHFKADVVISLMDAWVSEPDLMPRIRYCPWFPVDMEPIPPPVLRVVQTAFQPIVMSRFGARMASEAGLETAYVPHGVETAALCPMDRLAARERLRLPRDAFIVGMVAANKGNPSRKAFTYQIEAFARLRRAHSDARLFLQTTTGRSGENGGVNLPEFIEYLGLSWGMIGAPAAENADVVFSDQYLGILGFNDDYMRTLYNAFDLHMLVSMGEGFGVPILEAQSCGVPVLVGDWTAMTELCFAGWSVSRDDAEPWWTPLGAYQFVPRVGAIHEQLEVAYSALQNTRTRTRLSRKARLEALDYDADLVTERYWGPVLEQMTARIRGTVNHGEAA